MDIQEVEIKLEEQPKDIWHIKGEYFVLWRDKFPELICYKKNKEKQIRTLQLLDEGFLEGECWIEKYNKKEVNVYVLSEETNTFVFKERRKEKFQIKQNTWKWNKGKLKLSLNQKD